MAVSVSPRDITFDFNDSCNCCIGCLCFHKKDSKNPRVYINTRGEVEPYSSKKARKNIDETFQRAVDNLELAIENNVKKFSDDVHNFHVKINRIIRSTRELQQVNLSHIYAINELMIAYFEESNK